VRRIAILKLAQPHQRWLVAGSERGAKTFHQKLASRLLTSSRSKKTPYNGSAIRVLKTMEQIGTSLNENPVIQVCEDLSTPVWVFDFDKTRVVWANEAALQLWGATSSEELAARDMSVDTTPSVVKHLNNIRKRLRNGARHAERWTIYPHGQPRHCFLEYRSIELADGRDAMLVECTGQDISGDNDALRSIEALRHTSLMISLYSEDYKLLYSNPAARIMLQDSTSHLRDRFANPADWHRMLEEMQQSDEFVMEALMNTASGARWHKMHFQHSRDAVTGQWSFLVSESDVTKLHDAEREGYRLARTDSLTGFANRHYLQEKFQYMSANSDAHAGVIYIDLDRFKYINDSLGHSTGDQLLIGVAQTIRQCTGNNATLVRLGGDEFLILLEPVRDYTPLVELANTIIDKLANPLIIDNTPLRVTPSIGICIYPDDAHSTEALLQHADIAMYRSKAEGGNQYHIFTEAMRQDVQHRQQTEQELSLAIQNEQFRLHYQARYGYDGTTIIGAEALVRWAHPQKGLLFPSEFIALAEETGLIDELGAWVLMEGARQAAKWYRQGHNLCVSVNLSPRQFASPDFAEHVQRVLVEAGCPAHLLELEITESMLLHDIPRVLDILSTLHNLGVKTAIDDFGTGYSNLFQLQSLDIDCLKIDKAFVQSIDRPAILQMILSLGKMLDMNIVAEGIETQEQLEWLQRHGCNEFQGYHLARPMDECHFESLLGKSKERVAAPQEIELACA
jgi:diguanylate cyclase (GGDEF)-like protein